MEKKKVNKNMIITRFDYRYGSLVVTDKVRMFMFKFLPNKILEEQENSAHKQTSKLWYK